MRPTPQEIVSGVTRTLKDTVAPHVRDEYAANRLREACAALDQLSWNDVGVALSDENDAVATLLADWCDWVDADGARVSAFAAQRAEVDAVLDESDDACPPEPFDDLNTRNAALAQTLTDVAAAVRQWADGDDARSAAAQPVLSAMLEHYSTAARRSRQTDMSQ
jgi:hypothetical protein